jgi:hypothetical protein
LTCAPVGASTRRCRTKTLLTHASFGEARSKEAPMCASSTGLKGERDVYAMCIVQASEIPGIDLNQRRNCHGGLASGDADDLHFTRPGIQKKLSQCGMNPHGLAAIADRKPG